MIIYNIKKTAAIYAFYQGWFNGYELLNFICLEMSDKMPTDILRQLLGFCIQFLNTAFAKNTLSGFVCLHNDLCRVEF